MKGKVWNWDIYYYCLLRGGIVPSVSPNRSCPKYLALSVLALLPLSVVCNSWPIALHDLLVFIFWRVPFFCDYFPQKIFVNYLNWWGYLIPVSRWLFNLILRQTPHSPRDCFYPQSTTWTHPLPRCQRNTRDTRWWSSLSPKTLRNETKKLQLSLAILWTEQMSTLSFCGRNKPVCRANFEFPCLFVPSAISINLRPSSRDTSLFCPGNTHSHPHTSCLTSSWRTASASWNKSLLAACTVFNAFT